MKKIQMFFVFLLLVLTLACRSKEQQEEAGYQIYCVNQEGNALETESCMPQAEGGDALIQEMIGKLNEAPVQPGHQKAIPDGIGITSYVHTEKNLKVDFNGTYSEMDHITEVFCRAAVVKTLVQIPEVHTVEFTVNGQELTDGQGNPIGVMSDDTFIDTKGEGINSYQYAALTLYFADKSGKKLGKETRSIHYSSNQLLERLVLEELMRGTENENLQAVFPKEAKILDVSVEKKLCIVNLDSAYSKASGLAVLPETAVYAIVNTLCENCDVEQVQFRIDGDSKEKLFGKIDISQPFEKKEDIVEQNSPEKTPGVGVDPALQE